MCSQSLTVNVLVRDQCPPLSPAESVSAGFQVNSHLGSTCLWFLVLRHTHPMAKFYSDAQNSCSGYRAPRASPCLLSFFFSTRDDNLMIKISFLLSQRVFPKSFSPPHVHLCGVTATSCAVEERRAGLPRQKAFLRFLPLLCCSYPQPGAATSCFPRDKRDLCFQVMTAKTQLQKALAVIYPAACFCTEGEDRQPQSRSGPQKYLRSIPHPTFFDENSEQQRALLLRRHFFPKCHLCVFTVSAVWVQWREEPWRPCGQAAIPSVCGKPGKPVLGLALWQIQICTCCFPTLI